MVGFCFTSKKSLPFNFPFFMPLPVSTLSAWILISRTPVDTSGDLKVREASHLSNLPSIATDASTSNLIELSTGVTLKTGIPSPVWAWLTQESTIDTKMQNGMGLMAGGVSYFSHTYWILAFLGLPRLYSLLTTTLKLFVISAH